jgi:hypothetical protein
MNYDELQNIISGVGNKEPGNLIQVIAQKLGRSKAAGTGFEKDNLTKQQLAAIPTKNY